MKNTEKRNIKGKQVHRNTKTIDEIAKLTSGSAYPNQRAFTKPIDPVMVKLANKINKLCDKLCISRNDLLNISYRLGLNISNYTIGTFLNRKYGPAFPPTIKTREAMARIKKFLISQVRTRQYKQNKQNQTK